MQGCVLCRSVGSAVGTRPRKKRQRNAEKRKKRKKREIITSTESLKAEALEESGEEKQEHVLIANCGAPLSRMKKRNACKRAERAPSHIRTQHILVRFIA
jgi:hypothetical protein